MSTIFCLYCGKLLQNTVGIEEDQAEEYDYCSEEYEKDREYNKYRLIWH